MSKTKQLSQYNGTAWETPIDIGADAANVDYPLSDDTTKPLDEVIGSVGASDSNLVTQINGKLSTNGAIDNTVLNQGPDITTYPTSGQVNDGNLVVSAGDDSRTLWSKFNAFRGRVVSNFSNYIKATLVTSGTGVSSAATDAQVYSAKAIQNYFNSVIGYNSASDVSSLGSVASQLSSLNSNKANTAAVTTGSLHDITKSGNYYLTGNVSDKPTSQGGIYLFSALADNSVRAGIFYSPYKTDAGLNVVYSLNGIEFVNKIFGVFKYTVSGTTSTSGAILIPTALQGKVLYGFTPTNFTGFVVQRDQSYFTVCKNDLTGPLANTPVSFIVYYSYLSS